MLGLGAAWYEREHVALGVPFYPIAERLERLEETLQICLQMWSGDDGPYEGKHYRLAETLNVPPPIRRPRPPIMIGGGGERKLLRLVAKYADANNLFPSSPEEVRHKLDVLARHCEEVGRDRSEIRNTTISRVGPDTDVDTFVAEPSLDRIASPDSACSRRPATRTWKNSSMLDEKIAQYLRRSSSGRVVSLASSSTRAWKSICESSRLSSRPSGSIPTRVATSTFSIGSECRGVTFR